MNVKDLQTKAKKSLQLYEKIEDFVNNHKDKIQSGNIDLKDLVNISPMFTMEILCLFFERVD